MTIHTYHTSLHTLGLELGDLFGRGASAVFDPWLVYKGLPSRRSVASGSQSRAKMQTRTTGFARFNGGSIGPGVSKG